jgi:hypothetical protein
VHSVCGFRCRTPLGSDKIFAEEPQGRRDEINRTTSASKHDSKKETSPQSLVQEIVGQGESNSLSWYDRTGKLLGQAGPRAPYNDVTFSGDRKTFVLDQRDPTTGRYHTVTVDLERGVFSRLNPEFMETTPLRYPQTAMSPSHLVTIFICARSPAPETQIALEIFKYEALE